MNAPRILTATIASLLLTAALHAQTWDGGGFNDNFNNATNWNPNVAPTNNGTANLIFAGTTRLTPLVNIPYDVNGVTFNNTAGAFNIMTSGGSVLAVRGGGITNLDTDLQTFFLTPVTFGTGSSTNAINGPLNFSGAVEIGINAITVNGDFDTDFDLVTGTGAITKNGNGTLNIASGGTQQYSLTVNSGVVDLDTFVSFGGGAVISVNGGTLDLFGTNLSGSTLTRSATGTLTGSFNANSGATVNLTGAFTTGVGIYSVQNSGTTFSSGNLQITNTATFRVLSGADVALTGDLDVGLTGSSGTLEVSGVGSTFAIPPNLSPNFGLNGAANVTFSSGATGSFPTSTLIFANAAGSSANVVVSGGSQISAGTFSLSPFSSSGPSDVLVTGAGSKLVSTFNVAPLNVGSSTGGSAAVLKVENGAELALSGPLTISPSGTLDLNGGLISLNLNQAFTNNGTFNFHSGRINLGQDLGLSAAGSPVLGANLVLSAGREVTVPASRVTTVGTGGALVLDGGYFETGTLTRSGGVIDLQRGTLRITGSTGFVIGDTGPLGASVTLPANVTLQLTPSLTVNATSVLLVEGGRFEGTTVTNNGSFLCDRGSAVFNTLSNNSGAQFVTSGSLEISGTGTNSSGARLEVSSGTGRITGAGTLTNLGLLTGDGTVAKPFTNGTSGRIRVDTGKTLLFSGAFNPNQGELNLQGGTVDVAGPMTNAAGAFISGRGALYTGGLTNSGVMAFSGGNADIHGDVVNASGARIVTSGAGATTTFFDDVTHNGLEIFTGANASTVFFGGQTGAGSFTGTGTVYFNGDLRPGNSPATVRYGGDLVLGGASSLTLEIGGLVAGQDYDRLEVAGDFVAAGALAVALLADFTPHFGDSFDLFDARSVGGSFADVSLPELASGLSWDATSLQRDGQLRVVPEPGIGALFALGLACLGFRRKSSPTAP